MMVLLKVFLFQLALFASTLATTNCPVSHFWNGTSCQICSTCPPGFGLKEKCTEKGNTECQACWPGFDYSNSSDMERCTGCDKYSNCLPGNPKVIKNCTIFSGVVCQGCAEGSFFDPYEGPNGGCTECSPPCGMFEKEVRSCKTEHDRLCSKQWTKKEILVPSTVSVSKEKVPVSTKSVADVENDDSSGVAKAKPLHEKSWFWVAISSAAVVIVLPVVVITAVRCRNQGGRDISARTPRPANTRGDIMMQQRSPLMPCVIGLELPIKDLSLEQKRFIAEMLNDRDPFGHFYWQRIAEKVGLRNRSGSWSGQQNPTDSFLKTYGERSGNTVGTLIDALTEDGLTHFASQIKRKFSTVQNEEEEEVVRMDETPVETTAQESAAQ